MRRQHVVLPGVNQGHLAAVREESVGDAQADHASADDGDVQRAVESLRHREMVRREAELPARVPRFEKGTFTMTTGIGILGAGAIARVHAQGIADAGGHLAGFCDPLVAKAEEAASSCGGRAWSSLDEFLGCDQFDRVVVAVPNEHHASLAIAAMEAGKDVLLEKPMALEAGQCQDIIAARDRTGRTLQVGFVCRFAATVLAARRHIGAGRLGTVYQARAVMLRRRGIPGLGRWFTDRARSGGGVLIDLGPHLVDLVLHLCDRPTVSRVSAATSSRFGQPPHGYRFTEMWSGPPNLEGVFNVDDGATAMLRCEDGPVITLETAWASHLPDGTIGDGVTLFGDRAAMHFDIWGNSVLIGTQMDEEIVDVTHPIPAEEGWGTAFKREHECFAANCGGAETGPSGEEGAGVQAVLDAMYQSADAGAEVAVTP